ncbi:cystathionine gamma-synthase [Gallaecimonas xiamenensis]|uniref:O-succinylhomoserine (Thiol)-lyase n=1 Tax=Gallaecimonas xiamenensis 3-C-1 TaxID=745411 RepID=K2J249_9GAMM|nr:cystathionine gamma-synthase [Gallaecimonas xiamenensis]EKE77051.1 O-succinylhomoserine (thiol)-lyase [Gallaecimonas xiamenensis 3-C-1]
MSNSQSTNAVRAGIDTDHQFNAVVPPLYLSTNYRFHDIHTPAQYDYTRSGNPTRDLLGQAIADLEGGARGVITATGMGAVTLALQLLSPGDTLVVPHDCYGGSWRLFNALAKKGSFKLLSIDQGDAQALAQALAENPKLVWVETPSNPLLRVVDVQAICEQAHAVGALVLVDNTFLSPIGQQPLALGADLVLHSTTKYLNGHSDVVGGAVVAKDQALGDELAWWANCIGITGAPFDAFLTLRGLRTLAARFRIHEENAQQLVAWLDAQPEVAVINYPGLASHPGHELAKRQQKSFGAMFSVEFKADVAALGRFVSRLKLFSLAESLGGVESLVAVPATMTHAAMSPEARQAAGIGDGLLRFSVGIEDAADLIADLAQAWPALKGE